MRGRGPVRAAIVGAGLMGRWHARAVARAGSVVVAVIDADPARAAALAAEYPGARAAATLASVSGEGVEAVHICAPLAAHEPLSRDAIAMGMHVLMEKPLLATARATAALLELAAQRGVLVCPVHQFPFQRGVCEIIARLPAIGPVLHLQALSCSAGAGTGDAELRDRVAADILPHPLSLAAAILESAMSDVAWCAQRSAPGELVIMGRSGAASISIVVSLGGRPTANELHVIGERGSAHADLYHGYSVVEDGRVSRGRKILHPFALSSASLVAAGTNLLRRAATGESAYPGLRELVAAFHDAVAGRSASPITPVRILDIARARDAILAGANN